jgi:cell shape-determining protein MreC
MIGRHERGRATSMRSKIFLLIGAGALLFLTINFLFAPSAGDACTDKSSKNVMEELKTESKRREELKRQYEELEHKVERLTVDLAVARGNYWLHPRRVVIWCKIIPWRRIELSR